MNYSVGELIYVMYGEIGKHYIVILAIGMLAIVVVGMLMVVKGLQIPVMLIVELMLLLIVYAYGMHLCDLFFQAGSVKISKDVAGFGIAASIVSMVIGELSVISLFEERG